MRVVDWRNAPVSRIYYRYQEGDSYEESFGENESDREQPENVADSLAL